MSGRRSAQSAAAPPWVHAPGRATAVGAGGLGAAVVSQPHTLAAVDDPAVVLTPGHSPYPVGRSTLPPALPTRPPTTPPVSVPVGSASTQPAEPLCVPSTAAPEGPAPEPATRRGRVFLPSPARPAPASSHDNVAPLERPLAAWEPVNVAEAAGFAVRFAADYLSWDELEPARRRAALRTYLTDPDLADIGWSGRGRQRADLVTAGRTVTLCQGLIVVVEVTARLVVFHRIEDAQPSPRPLSEATPPMALAPASAPPSADPGWFPGASWWVRIAPPVRRANTGHLVVDIDLDLTTQS